LQKKLKKNFNRIGVLGGSFDPPHIGHLYISKQSLKKIKLKKVIWLITKQNPFKKKPSLDIKTRIKLSKGILKKEKKISVKYIDNIIKSKNTFDVLKYLKGKNKKSELFFIIGADNFINFHKWKNWKKIPKLAKIVIFTRSKYSSKALNSVAAKKLPKSSWKYISTKKINISSSLIKKFW